MYGGAEIDRRLRWTIAAEARRTGRFNTESAVAFAAGGVLRVESFPEPIGLSPVRRHTAELLRVSLPEDTVTAELLARYHRVSREHAITRGDMKPDWLVDSEPARHPRGWRYPAGAATRALAHARENPGAVVTGWAAAALLGIPEFSDGADTQLLTRSRSRGPDDPQEPRLIRPRNPVEAWQARHRGLAVAVVPPMYALGTCVREALSGRHAWDVPAIPGLAGERVRAVQVIDRFRRVFVLSAADVREGCAGLVHNRELAKALKLSDPSADSGWETLTPLIVDPIVRGHGIALRSQIRLGEDGSPVGPDEPCMTVLDLGSVEFRVAVYYDGGNHLERRRRDRDAKITASLLAAGWMVLRVSAGMVRDTGDLVRRFTALCESAAGRPRAG